MAFNQVRVAEIIEIEFDFDAADNTQTVARLLVRSAAGEHLAIELPFSMWSHVQEALAAGRKEFPEGRRRQ